MLTWQHNQTQDQTDQKEHLAVEFQDQMFITVWRQHKTDIRLILRILKSLMMSTIDWLRLLESSKINSGKVLNYHKEITDFTQLMQMRD